MVCRRRDGRFVLLGTTSERRRDSDLLTVRPDDRVEVRPSILLESDGPMLIVGPQQAQGQLIQLPHDPAERPDPVRLERRYEQFVPAS